MGLSTEEKAVRIIEAMRDYVNAGARVSSSVRNGEREHELLLRADWGGNSLTVFDQKGDHSHIGAKDGSTADLIDALYDLMERRYGDS